MRALVTGAAGLIGSNLCVELERRGHDVTGLDDFSHGSFANLVGFGGDVVSADLLDAPAWQEAVGSVDVVFHQAALTDTTVTDELRMMRANVEAFRTLLRWVAAGRARQVVYASSAGVYGDGPLPMREDAAPNPKNVYAYSKVVMEKVARDFSSAHPRVPIAGLRNFNVFGPGERFKDKSASMIWQLAQQMLQGRRPRIFEFGEQYRDFIYVKDVVEANCLAAIQKARGAFNVATGRKTTFNEIIAHLNLTLGTNLEPEYFKNPYAFYQSETLGDPSKAEKEFGFAAGYTALRGIADYLGGLKKAKVPA